jgi:hypothetical protein
MLWSILRTIKYDSRSLEFEMESVNPARVARFWVPDAKKVEKKEKVKLVGGWLDGKDGLLRKWQLDLGFGKGVEKVFEREKKDDLADSLLQGVAWAVWIGRRRRVAGMGEGEVKEFLDGLG